jgi:hypothetical protein
MFGRRGFDDDDVPWFFDKKVLNAVVASSSRGLGPSPSQERVVIYNSNPFFQCQDLSKFIFEEDDEDC